MKRTLIDFWVGFFVLLGICAIVFMALRIANQATLSNAQTYTLTAYFTNIGGLKIRSPVKSAGVTVGRVKSVELDISSYQARVTLDIERAFLFSSDTSAAILTSGLLGEQYVSLETGADEEMLKEGDTISLTSSAMVLESLIGKFIMSKASESSQ